MKNEETKNNIDLRNGMEKKWWHDYVVYQIYVQSFNDSNGDGIGDLNGITQRLDYFKELGTDCLWLTPIMESPFADCGYDCSDHYKINPDFGTMEDFENLLKMAHGKGLKVIIDIVPGYTSDKHKWFVEARKNKNAPTRNFYVWGIGENGGPPNNWYSCAAAMPAWTFNKETEDYYYHAFLPSQPHLNWNCVELQDEMFKVFKFWLDKGIDGYRIDAINYCIADDERRNNPGEMFKQVHIFERNHQNIHGMLKRFRELSDQYPDQMMVGEIFPGYPTECKEFYGHKNDEIHLNFNLSISQIIKKGRWYDGNYTTSKNEEEDVCGFTVKEFREAIQDQDLVFSRLNIWPTVVLGNHDQPRVYSSYERLVDKKYADRMAKLVAGYTLLSKGTSFMYYGEEIGMENMKFGRISELKDTFGVRFFEYLRDNLKLPEENALTYAQNISRDVCRTPMQWDSTDNAGFSTNNNTWLKVNPDFKIKNVKA